MYRLFLGMFMVAQCLSGIVRSQELEETGDAGVDRLESTRQIFRTLCFDCHADGERAGGVALDEIWGLPVEPAQKEVWHRVLKQLRSGLMPPRGQTQPTAEQVVSVSDWIKSQALELDDEHPDPGKVTMRRLNRTEYRNTIRDLMGVDFEAQNLFPADDTGHGFDNIGDVLTLSPLLLEKYIAAAQEIVERAVPMSSQVLRQQKVLGTEFTIDAAEVEETAGSESSPATTAPPDSAGRNRLPRAGRQGRGDALVLSYYEKKTARATVELEHPGLYTLQVQLNANESYVDNVFDANKCELTFTLDGEQLLHREFVRQGGKEYQLKFERTLSAGPHELVFSVNPLTSEEQVRQLRLSIASLTFIGPDSPQGMVAPENYARAFPKPVPADLPGQIEYARELLAEFASKAFRRPVDAASVEKLVGLVEQGLENQKTFEAGVADAMIATLASPRFLFREELVIPASDGLAPLIDEYSLASRLSYFLWSSMPDEELMSLAHRGELRSQLDQQVSRMLADEKSSALFSNFTGQWLRVQEIDSVQINARSVIRREAPPDPEGEKRRARFFELFRKGDERTEEEAAEFAELGETVRRSFRGPRIELTDSIRRAMRRETELLFETIIREDRPLVELLDCNYTFLNEELAKFYGIEDVAGSEMRRVTLADGDVRGGVLTHGSFLAVTSNPDRTSPVKRGLFVLENLLGLSTGAPPPNIPALEEVAGEKDDGKKLSLRETLAIHRQDEKCSSCHNRMDPLGLALENFNALGRFREQEFGDPIDASGELLTGEQFSTIQELRGILASNRKQDYFYCLAEKLLTYALGRAVDYRDELTLDDIVEQIEANDGRASALLQSVIHSSAFQRAQSSTPENVTLN